MKNRKMRSLMSAAVLLLALLSPCAAAHGQSDGPFSNANGKSDGFFSNAGGVRNGGNGGSWNDVNGDGDGAAWNGMEDETPVGGGLLVLTAAGVCYAAARVKRLKSKD